MRTFNTYAEHMHIKASIYIKALTLDFHKIYFFKKL